MRSPGQLLTWLALVSGALALMVALNAIANAPATERPVKYVTVTSVQHYTWICYDPVDATTGAQVAPRDCRRVEVMP